MGRLRVRRHRPHGLAVAAAVVAVTAGLAGCGDLTGDLTGDRTGDRTGGPAPAVDRTDRTDRTDPGPEVATGLPVPTVRPAECRPGASHRLEAVGPEAALGHRYLTITLVNCGPEPLEVSGVPGIALDTGSGTAGPRTVRARPWERRPPVSVPPRGRAVMGLEYLVADRSPHVGRLELTVDAETSVLSGTLDLDTRSRLTAYPWVAEGESVWGS